MNHREVSVRCVVGSFTATVFPAAQNGQSRRKEPLIAIKAELLTAAYDWTKSRHGGKGRVSR